MSTQEQINTTIGEDVEITGNIKCESGIQINGKLNGDLTCGGQAQIGASSTIKGNMSVEMISVTGQVNGNITAKDKIELKASTRLHGDIRAKRLTVEDGVTFVGKVEVNPSGTAASKAQEARSVVEQDDEEPEKASGENQAKGIFRR